MAYMNGVRTVYCRVCGIKGHNRRTCPEVSPERKATEKSLYPRACGWCGEAGHDIRHCEKKATDYKEWYDRNAAVRRSYYETLAERDMFPGALVVADNGACDANGVNYTNIALENVPGKYVLMVEKILWEGILDSDIPSPRRATWKRRGKMKNKFIRHNGVVCRALCENAGEYDYWYNETLYITPREESYSYRGQAVVKLPGIPFRWEDLPEDVRNGTSGTDRLWKTNK